MDEGSESQLLLFLFWGFVLVQTRGTEEIIDCGHVVSSQRLAKISNFCRLRSILFFSRLHLNIKSLFWRYNGFIPLLKNRIFDFSLFRVKLIVSHFPVIKENIVVNR